MSKGIVMNAGANLTRTDIANQLGNSDQLVASQRLVSSLNATDIQYDDERTVATILKELEGGVAGPSQAVFVPSQTMPLTYNGKEQGVMLNGFDSGCMILSGVTRATDAGKYEAVISLKDGYHWADTGGTEQRTVPWVIEGIAVAIPQSPPSLTYSGHAQSPTIAGINNSIITLSGETSATDAGTYSVTATLAKNYQWSDGTTEPKVISWVIARASNPLTVDQMSVDLSSAAKTATIRVTQAGTGAISATSSDTSIATAKISATSSSVMITAQDKTGTCTIDIQAAEDKNYLASPVVSISVSVSVYQTLAVPSQSGSLTYTGSAQSPTWSGYDANKLTIGGATSGTTAGTYTAAFTPKSGYMWEDGTTGQKVVSWTIDRATVEVPTWKGTLTYTGSAQNVSWTATDGIIFGGSQSEVNAGTYNATATPDANHKWPDGTTGQKTIQWTIERASVQIPAQKTTLTYTGQVQNVVWTVTDGITFGGTQYASVAGTYNATVTPDANHKWPDGTTGQKTIQWTIEKGNSYARPDKSSVSLGLETMTATVNISRPGDGAVSASSSDTSVATVSVSGTRVTITGKADGSAIVSVTVAEGTNYKAATTQITVTCVIPNSDPNKATPEQVQAAAKAGVASNYWSVGDSFPIHLSDEVFDLDMTGTWYATILGFDHNSAKEGTNRIHFILGKNSTGTDIAFDPGFRIIGPNDLGICMCRQSVQGQRATNVGGWKDSYMRNTVMPKVLACFPAAWRAIISPVNKYTSNDLKLDIYNSNNAVDQVTATLDTVFLPSEFEIYGSNTYANPYEKDFQSQYQYYKNGNTRKRGRHDNATASDYWWLRSPRKNSTTFTMVDKVSPYSVSSQYADTVLGIAPAFTVA